MHMDNTKHEAPSVSCRVTFSTVYISIIMYQLYLLEPASRYPCSVEDSVAMCIYGDASPLVSPCPLVLVQSLNIQRSSQGAQDIHAQYNTLS